MDSLFDITEADEFSHQVFPPQKTSEPVVTSQPVFVWGALIIARLFPRTAP
jgi:hypothetical protein